MNTEMHMAIRLLNEHSLSVISGDRQIKNGTIMVQDDFLGTRYTIQADMLVKEFLVGQIGVVLNLPFLGLKTITTN